jgi:hypothetical protein
MVCINQHHGSRCAAHLGASKHDAEMMRLHMLSAGFQAMMGCHAKTHTMTLQAFLDASLHFRGQMLHGNTPVNR